MQEITFYTTEFHPVAVIPSIRSFSFPLYDTIICLWIDDASELGSTYKFHQYMPNLSAIVINEIINNISPDQVLRNSTSYLPLGC